MSLSIVIPTFERPENLALILDRISQSTKNKIHVLILTEPNSRSLPPDEKLATYSESLEIEVLVNECNVGVDESILRAYEKCKSEWIYFLGDSKLPVSQFEDIIDSAIAENPLACAHFFCYDSLLNATVAVRSLGDLVNSGLTLGDFILGGNGIFSRKIVDRYIKFSYRTLSSRIAHVAMPIMAIVKGEVIGLSKQKIIEVFIEKPDRYKPGKALLDCWASFSLLVMLPISFENASILNKYIVNYENTKSRVNFFKYCLLKVFREKVAISKDLKVIIKTRYFFYRRWDEWAMLYLAYLICLSMDRFRYSDE